MKFNESFADISGMESYMRRRRYQILISSPGDCVQFIATECGEVKYCPSKNAHSTNSSVACMPFTVTTTSTTMTTTSKKSSSIKMTFLANSI